MNPGDAFEEPGSPEPAKTTGQGHPLGPLVWRERLARPVLGRVVAAVLVAACGLALGLAAWLMPGTRRSLGVGPCGFKARTGLPCPTCGMTTSCCLTVRGRLGAAFRAQPLGPFLVAGAALCGLGCLVVASTGKTWVINWYRISPLTVVWVLGIAFIAAWGIKIVIELLEGRLPGRPG